MRSQSDYRCLVVPAWTTNYPALLSYAVPKSSPYAPFMFHAFLELLENGSLTALKARWKGVEPLCTPERITRLVVRAIDCCAVWTNKIKKLANALSEIGRIIQIGPGNSEKK